jgi:hypothetical protein
MEEGVLKLCVVCLAVIIIPSIHSVGPMNRGMGSMWVSTKGCFLNRKRDMIVFEGGRI